MQYYLGFCSCYGLGFQRLGIKVKGTYIPLKCIEFMLDLNNPRWSWHIP